MFCVRRTVGVRSAVVLADCGVMSDSTPDLHMLNVVVGDMAASLDFSHRLGSPFLTARLRPACTCS